VVSIGAPAPEPETFRASLAVRPQAAGNEGVSISLGLGIDLGGTKTVLALGDGSGNVRARSRRATEPSGDAERDVARLVEDARSLLRQAGVTPGDLAAVGIAAPGPQDRAAGLVLNPPNLPGWGRVPLRAALEDGLGVAVRLENDANAAALAEWRFGAGRGFDDVVYLTLSTGVGAGLVLGGRLQAGRSGNAGELGHLPVAWDGDPCRCGQRGCLEAYVGGAAWTRRLSVHTPGDSRVAELAGDGPPLPEHVIAAAEAGDRFACAEVARFNEYLVRGLCAVVFTLAPQVIVLGTIAAAAGEQLCLQPVRDSLARRVWPELARDVEIRAMQLGERLPELAGLCVAFPEG